MFFHYFKFNPWEGKEKYFGEGKEAKTYFKFNPWEGREKYFGEGKEAKTYFTNIMFQVLF